MNASDDMPEDETGVKWTWKTFLDVRPTEIQSIIRESRLGAIAGIGSAIIITVCVWPNSNPVLMISWFLVSVSLFSYISYRTLRAKQHTPKQRISNKPSTVSRKAVWRVAITAILYALPWVFLAMTTLSTDNLNHILLVLLLCCGMSVAGGLLLYRVPLASFLFAGVIIVAIIVSVVMREANMIWPMIIFALNYSAVIITVIMKSWKNSRETEESLERVSKANIKLREANDEIQRLAETDQLTGLYNREVFIRAIGQWARSKNIDKFAVLLLDLDRFKNINDTFGHSAGDELLVTVADRMNQTVKDLDIVARFGGDEFAVLVNLTNAGDKGRGMAKKIIEALSQPVKIQNIVINPNTSIGIALCTEQANDVSEYIRLADIALMKAKENGRGRYEIYTKEMAISTSRMDEIENTIKDALENNGFKLVYQPKFNLDTGEFAGAEIAMKWANDNYAEASTEYILKVAEMRGLIPEMSALFMDLVVDDLKYFSQNLDEMFPCAINIHPIDLKTPDLVVERVKNFAKHGFSLDTVTLEISEINLVGRGSDAIKHAFDTFDDLGVNISLDDFGSGYASLTNIRGLPLNEIKINSKLIHTLSHDQNPYEIAILKATLETAKCLNISCTVTGVSSLALVEKLKEINPIGNRLYGQGRLWTSPMNADEFVKFYRKQKVASKSHKVG